MFSTPTFPRTLTAALLLLAGAAQAQVTVTDAWVRGTVAQQTATGLFAQITSAKGGRLVAGSSPAAGVVEIHEMKMEGSTMRMRAIAGLDLPAGQAVSLKPGGHHLMLMDLKQPLKTGETVPVSLVIETAGGQRETVQVQAVVRAMSGGGGAAGGHGHHGHKH
ncbi:MAG: copper chaperone PCu(A)C [Betaproteobacteria bacterium]